MNDTPTLTEQFLVRDLPLSVVAAASQRFERELNAALAENTAMREAIREVFHSFADDPPSDASWLLDDRQNHALARLYPFITP
jgi:hypothetical protein